VSEPVVRSRTLVCSPQGARQPPRIVASRCPSGHLFHPPQPFGCERCGRDGGGLERVELEGRGTLAAIAIVYAHSKLPAPFVIGRIALDGGPSIEAMMVAPAAALPVGARVEARLEPAGTDERGTPVLECRFGAQGIDRISTAVH
jgi:uncharacterized protein